MKAVGLTQFAYDRFPDFLCKELLALLPFTVQETDQENILYSTVMGKRIHRDFLIIEP